MVSPRAGKFRICFLISRVFHHRYAEANAPATRTTANITAENISTKPAIAAVAIIAAVFRNRLGGVAEELDIYLICILPVYTKNLTI